MEYKYKRIVVGKNDAGKSAVLSTKGSNVQHAPDFYYRATLWKTDELPVDNSIGGDRAGESLSREPPPGGMHVRCLELYPESANRDEVLARMREANKQFSQKHEPTAEDSARHPLMHKTDTLDIIFVHRGEVFLITDVDETLCVPGDCIVIRGTNHAWSVRGKEPCMLMGVMICAKPLD